MENSSAWEVTRKAWVFSVVPGVRDEADARSVHAEPGQSQRRGDIGVLGITLRRLPRAALEEGEGRGERGKLGHLLGRRAGPGARRLGAGISRPRSAPDRRAAPSASIPPMAPAGTTHCAPEARAAVSSPAASSASARAPTEATIRSVPPASTAAPKAATAPCPAHSTTTSGRAASTLSSDDVTRCRPAKRRANLRLAAWAHQHGDVLGRAFLRSEDVDQVAGDRPEPDDRHVTEAHDLPPAAPAGGPAKDSAKGTDGHHVDLHDRGAGPPEGRVQRLREILDPRDAGMGHVDGLAQQPEIGRLELGIMPAPVVLRVLDVLDHAIGRVVHQHER